MASEFYDLTIVGAGIIGVSAAYLAAQSETSWRVLLIDRSLVCSGATYYSGGHNHPFGKTPVHKRLALASAAVFAELKAQVPELPLYELPLFGLVERTRAGEVIDGFIKEGVRPATTDEERQLRMTFPDLRISDKQVLLTGCSGGYGLPHQIGIAMMNLFRQQPLSECWEGVAVTNIATADNGFALSVSDGRTILTKRVLVATGPWALQAPGAEVFKKAGVRIKKIVSLHVDRVPQAGEPILYFFDEDCYLLPVAARRQWIFSFASQEWNVTPQSHPAISVEDRSLALSILDRYCPSFAMQCNGGRVFCDAYSVDGMPLVRQAAADFVIAGACSGYGFRLAPGIALDALQLYSGIHL